MARYIDAEQFRGKHEVAEVNGKLNSVILYGDIVNAPTADVAPKSEVAREIFKEIEEIFNKRIAFYTDMAKQSKFTEKHYAETMIMNCIIYLEEIAELKKKYTEGGAKDE